MSIERCSANSTEGITPNMFWRRIVRVIFTTFAIEIVIMVNSLRSVHTVLKVLRSASVRVIDKLHVSFTKGTKGS